uniref:Uncharacterized protein n=1 Tax=Rhizophora mucronata TaxID=61149 RepID=A0A2P2NXS4_RHIMU
MLILLHIIFYIFILWFMVHSSDNAIHWPVRVMRAYFCR